MLDNPDAKNARIRRYHKRVTKPKTLLEWRLNEDIVDEEWRCQIDDFVSGMGIKALVEKYARNWKSIERSVYKWLANYDEGGKRKSVLSKINHLRSRLDPDRPITKPRLRRIIMFMNRRKKPIWWIAFVTGLSHRRVWEFLNGFPKGDHRGLLDD